MKPIRLVLVENHPAIRSGIRLLLKRVSGVQIVAEANGLHAALQAIQVHQPDVVLLDFPLPRRRTLARPKPRGLSRFVQLRRLTEECPGVRVILLSRALRIILRGDSHLSWAASRRAVQPSKAPTKPTELTARQRQVLELIAHERNTKEVADALGISVKTVETHRSHLMQRLNTRSVAGLVRHAIAMGWVSLEDCPGPVVRQRSVARAA